MTIGEALFTQVTVTEVVPRLSLVVLSVATDKLVGAAITKPPEAKLLPAAMFAL